MRREKFPIKLHVLISNNKYNAINIRRRPQNIRVFNGLIDILIIDMVL